MIADRGKSHNYGGEVPDDQKIPPKTPVGATYDKNYFLQPKPSSGPRKETHVPGIMTEIYNPHTGEITNFHGPAGE